MRRIICGLTILALLGAARASAAGYAPVDCAKAHAPAPAAICKDYALGQAEARMATLFGIAASLVPMGRRGNIQDAQTAWLRMRDACGGDKGCLSNAYTLRIRQLNAIIADIASRGPY